MFIIHHIIFEPIKRFLLDIGGLFRWCFFQFLNVMIEEKYSKDLEYFTNNKSEFINKNGFTVANKNMFVAFAIIIFTIIIIEKNGQ
ncbi:MAG: hypothetical protein H7239_10615 [Flavobacterium sp.]|nr:hypothetical protein [Flavobacterium sp.]